MNALEAGLYKALSEDSALVTELGGTFVYNQIAPQQQARPYIVFMHTGGGHENINPSDLQNHVYLVKAVTNEQSQAGDVDNLVLDVLHKETLTVTGYTNFQTQREEEVRMVEVLSNGKLVFHAGAYYRVRIDD